MRTFQRFTDFRRIHSLAISEYASLPRRNRKWDHMYFRDKWILSVICSILMALKSEFWKKIDFTESSKLATNLLKIVYVCSLLSCLDDLGYFWEKCGISQHWRTKLIEDNDWYFDDPRRVLFSGMFFSVEIAFLQYLNTLTHVQEHTKLTTNMCWWHSWASSAIDSM